MSKGGKRGGGGGGGGGGHHHRDTKFKNLAFACRNLRAFTGKRRKPARGSPSPARLLMNGVPFALAREHQPVPVHIRQEIETSFRNQSET